MPANLIRPLKICHYNFMTNNEQHTIVVLPLGAHEQHGPHLPFETDAIIASELASRLKSASDGFNLFILPTETIGYSIEHLDFDGTKSLAHDEAVNRWLDIIKTQYDQGCRKVLLLNAHGGNSPLLTIVATEARVRWNMLVVVTHWARFGLPDALTSKINKSIDIHAGQIETSIMLAIAPERVALERARDFSSKQEKYSKTYTHLKAYGPHAFGWKMSDLNNDGAVGAANLASADNGEMIINHAVDGLKKLVEDMDRFDVSNLT